MTHIGGPPDPIPALREKTGLKMTSLETFTHGHVSIVRLTADDGSEGWGQISTYDADISEYSIEDAPWTEGLFEPALRVVDGDAPMSEEPGWGVRFSPAWLEKAQRQRSEA